MATALTDAEITALRAILEASESLENVNTVLDLDEATSLSLSDIFYLIQGTGSKRDRKLTLEALMYFIKSNVETLSKMKLTFTGSGYGLDVDGRVRVSGLATFKYGVHIENSVDIGRDEDAFMEVHCPTKFFDNVDVGGGLNVNAHEADTTGGYMTSAGSSGFSVKDTNGNVLLSVSTVNGNPETEVGRFKAISTSTFVGATTFYGSVACTDNVVVGSQAAKRLFQVNGSDFYVSDSDGAAHANTMVCTRLVVNNAADVSGNLSAASISTGFTRVTADVNLHTSYPSAGQKQRRVIYNDSSNTIDVTLDSTGNYVHLRAQTCGDFICVSASDSDGTTWRPINGEAAIN